MAVYLLFVCLNLLPDQSLCLTVSSWPSYGACEAEARRLDAADPLDLGAARECRFEWARDGGGLHISR